MIDAVLLVASALPSGAVILYLIEHLSQELHVSTTTLGYPIYNDWNYSRYFTEYRLVIYAFPLLTAAVFLALITVGRWAGLYGGSTVGAPRALGATEGEAPRYRRSDARLLLHHVARSAVVGGVLGAEVAIAQRAVGAGFWSRLAAGAIILAATCALVLTLERLRTGLAEKISAIMTVLGAVATLPGLAWIAATTTVTVQAGGAVHIYNWFPLKVALPVTLAAAATVLGLLWLARADPKRTRRVADRSVIFLAVPVAAYLSYAFIPGESVSFSFYEYGQALATVNFLSHGSLPYRDFYSLHGLLNDGLQPLVGMSLLSHSYWGMNAGMYLIIYPLTMALLYAFAAAMYERAWPLAFLAVVIPGYLTRPGFYALLMMPYARFMLWPVVLILLKITVSRRTIGWSAVLGVSLIVAAMLTPEAAYFIPAIGVAVMARDIYCHDQGWRPASFSRTIGVTLGGAAMTAPIVAFLLWTHSMGSFIGFYRLVATDHNLIAASPIAVDLHDPLIFTAAAAPVAATLLTMLWIGLRLRWHMPLIDLDWVMVAAAILTAVYYEKWLAIPDLHVLEAYGAALPLILAWGARIFIVLDSAGDKTIGARMGTAWIRLPVAIQALRPRSPVSAAAFAVAVIAMHAALLTWAPVTAQQYRTAVAANPQNALLGYMAPGVVNEAQIQDVRTFLTAYMRPGEGIFDFSNTPGLYYYLLPYRPVTLTYELSGVSDQGGQEWLIAQLSRASPKFVVWNSLSGMGLPIWGSVWNMVRLYLVSQYILNNYRPFAMVAGEVFYVKKASVVLPPSSVPLSPTPITQGLDFVTPCSWGYAPNFLSARPAPTAARRTAETVPAASAATLPAPSGVAWSHFQWVRVGFGHAPPADSLAIFDNQAPNHSMTFRTTGRGPSEMWIPISACAQWHGYGSETLTITQTNPQPLTLTLVP